MTQSLAATSFLTRFRWMGSRMEAGGNSVSSTVTRDQIQDHLKNLTERKIIWDLVKCIGNK